jgi:glutamate/tyrosine decarboxylase-like PLP-dependent enzyme
LRSGPRPDIQEFAAAAFRHRETVWTERETLWSAGWYMLQEAVGGWVIGCSAAIFTALVLARWRHRDGADAVRDRR